MSAGIAEGCREGHVSQGKRPTAPLTEAQLETQAGMELLALCQTMTEDGSALDREISDLREWLERNRESDFPSVGFLTAAAKTILADGKVEVPSGSSVGVPGRAPEARPAPASAGPAS